MFLANVTGNQLLHNNGDGTFTDVTGKAGLNGPKQGGKKLWSIGAGWFDYNNDGLLDLFVVNYFQWEMETEPLCGTNGIRGYCDPKYYNPTPDTLYRNNGDGTFMDVSGETGIAAHLGKGMSVSFADYDGDGFLDVFVTNDTMPNFLFHNLGGKKFEEVGKKAWVAYGSYGYALSGMGADFRDVQQRRAAGHMAHGRRARKLSLVHQFGGGEFSNEGSGVEGPTSNMSGSGQRHLRFRQRRLERPLRGAMRVRLDSHELKTGAGHPEPNSVFRNLGNSKFQELSATAGPDFPPEAPHRGVAFGDIDNDGRVDMVVSVLGGPAKLLHNVSTGDNHWILLNLMGTKSNRMGIGAQVHIVTADGRSQWNEVTTAVGFACSSDSRVHFGLGPNRLIKQIEIRWPSGIRQTLQDVSVDRIATIEEPRQ